MHGFLNARDKAFMLRCKKPLTDSYLLLIIYSITTTMCSG